MAKPVDVNQLFDKLALHLKLEWDYAQPDPPGKKPGKMRSPGGEHLRDLASMGQIGHVRGIDAKLSELAADPENRPLVEALRRHMDVFDFDGYAELLERMSHEPD